MQMSRAHVVRFVVTGALALLTLPTCTLAAEIPAGVRLAAKQELVRQNGTEVDSLDIAQIQTVQASNVANDLYEGLTSRNTSSKVVPGVAERWKQTSPTTWVFTLRKDARWSNGDPVTAEDFVYSWQRTVDPKTATQYGLFLAFLKNGNEIMAGKMPVSALGIKALDKYTLQITTVQPTAFLPDMLANAQMGPLHKASVLKYGKDFTKPGNLVSNGAYRLKEWVVNSRLVLEKNPFYWDAKQVAITKVTFNPTESEDSATKMFEAGQVDTVDQIPPGSHGRLASRYGKQLKDNTVLGLYYFSLNNADPALKDSRVRQALSMVIDRDILTKKVLAEGQAPAYGLIVAGTDGAAVTAYDWSRWPMAQRIAEAKKLLAAAGYGPDRPLTLKLSYNTSDQNKKITLFLLSEFKSKLGINGSMENQEFKVFLKTRHDGNYQVARNGWNADYNDANTFLDLVRCNSDQNDTHYCNKTVDALIGQGNQSLEPAKRKALLTGAAKTAMNDYPVIPLFQYARSRLIKSYVGGWNVPNPMDGYKTQYLYIVAH